MPSFVFDNVALGLADDSLPLSTANFYAHLVTSEPTGSTGTASGLAVVTGGNYAARDLTGKQVSAVAGGGAKLTFTNTTWVGLYAGATTPVVGLVVCRKVSGSFAGTDPTVSYLQLQAPYEPPAASPGRDFTFQFSADGVLALIKG
jgi:hypothetical protein